MEVDIKSQFRWYMLSVTSFVVPGGIQMVLFPWLIAVQLHESAERLGIAQMMTQLPGLLLILFGGLLADRIDGRKILMTVHMVAALPVFVLAITIGFGILNYYMMLAFAVAMGTAGAFSQPARDALLNRVAGGQIQRTVTITMGLTFGAQILGFLVASLADQTGPVPLLFVQGTILLVGTYTAYNLAKGPPVVKSTENTLTQMLGGLRLVYRSKRMWPSTVLISMQGVFYGGAFVVLNPLIIRDVYGGDASAISLSYGAFFIGTILTSVILVRRGGIIKQGRAILAGAVVGGVFLGSAYFNLPFQGYLVAICLWGMCGGLSMTMGRTIMQEAAPQSHRARIMSVFSLANMGGMPMGAVLMGFCAGEIGPLASLLVAVGGIWLVAAVLCLTTQLALVEATTMSQEATLADGLSS